ncbi:uncharacterized protein pps isoform X2 [Epargyreus clarus]|uniref:uncharacterized protein pps isoform X2 n=1 Tax=Epargyreus clarus TaxID=520877 RepID=UPI003C2E1077
MSNTVITNYTDLNGPSSKTDSSVVVIVNKDGSLSVDQKLLGTLMGSDGSQTAGISVVRVGHEGKPDDATDSENEDDKVPHVTLSVDSYFDEPNSIIKYDSGAEMLQSLRIETRENSLVGFHNDHCYTPLKSPSETISQVSDTYKVSNDPIIEIVHNPQTKPLSNSKKITILEQQIIPKGKKIVINPSDAALILKGNALNKTLPVITKSKHVAEVEKKPEIESRVEDNTESSSVCSSGDSMADRDSDSDYKDVKDKSNTPKLRKTRMKPRILKAVQPAKTAKLEPRILSRLKPAKNIIRKESKDRILNKVLTLERTQLDSEPSTPKENQLTNAEVPTTPTPNNELSKIVTKPVQKVIKKEKRTPAHVSALLSDMTSLFSTPDVIRRVSTDNKTPSKTEKELSNSNKKAVSVPVNNKGNDVNEESILQEVLKSPENAERVKNKIATRTYPKQKEKTVIPIDKSVKGYDQIPQIDDASLAQILQDTVTPSAKSQPSISTASVINSPGLAGPLSPTLDLLGGLQPEEDGLTEDLLMHVAQLVESSENLQEVIDKQVLGKVDTTHVKAQIASPYQQQQEMHLPMQSQQQMQQPVHTPTSVYNHNAAKSGKCVPVRKDPIEIVRRDGRVITLPPIEAPATRASKRKNQVDTSIPGDTAISTPPLTHSSSTPEPVVQPVSRQYTNKKLTNKKQEQQPLPVPVVEKMSAESQESWNSEDDPNRLWCICKQPHNNRFMICCDGCEDWFHGKCVNITKAMGQQMEEQGIEWRCPNCKNEKNKNLNKSSMVQNAIEVVTPPPVTKDVSSKTICIVCKKPARASSIYCSDACILKHAQDSLSSQIMPSKVDNVGGKTDKPHSESRVIVYERKTGRLLAGPNAPTADNLKGWLQKHPTFEVVRPGTLSAIKPNLARKKASTEPNKIQTTLNFARIPRKSNEQMVTPLSKSISEPKEKSTKPLLSPKEEVKMTPQPKTPATPKSQMFKFLETPKASTSRTMSEPKKPARSANRSQSGSERAPSASPSTSRRKDSHDSKSRMSSIDPIRDNVRKGLQEQMSTRMAESDGPKFTEDEIQQFAYDTENELHELFSRDVGMKYKAKYRSLMFNIKDRKNLTLWEKICDRSITPKQLVRLSPEELASQELAQWRDKEAKHQLELIKKSELDLLAASKTYVLKTHKGEEVMENKESVSTELDPNVPVEDVVTALNDAVAEESTNNVDTSDNKTEISSKKSSSRKKDKDSRHSKKGESKRYHEKRIKSRSRRKSELKERNDPDESSLRKSRKKKSTRTRSESKNRSKKESPKEKSVSRDRSRHRSRSRVKSKRYSKEHSRSNSRARDRSRSNERLKRRSRSKDNVKRSRRSRSKNRSSTEEKTKHRSRSQDAVSSKNKNDSTDSDSVERPKSATLKEVHPEYDPHEPMITSALSEEDLRKSREDVYDESYKNEASDFGDGGYEPSKSFSIDTNVILPPTPYINKQDKASAESDQEPTSTVDNSTATVWNGCINMVDVARFYVAAHEVSGNAVDLEEDLSTELDIVGRINPETVWDYINKMRRASNKDIVVLRLQAANDEEMMQYIALYSYLSSRNRLGVVKVTNTATVKDFYIVPLPANTALPAVLLPFDGPGLGDVKTHLLVAIIIRQRKKRAGPPIPKDIIPAKVARESRKRSYTPPLAGRSPGGASPRRRALPLPATYSSPALSTSVKDKIAASLAAADEDEAYSPGSSSSGGSIPATATGVPNSNVLRSKMEELNRQIEEQKQQILKMAQADSSMGEDEAYSPSRPMTPPPPMVPLADIALPSNLQEILATIKQRSEKPAADVDMRQLP